MSTAVIAAPSDDNPPKKRKGKARKMTMADVEAIAERVIKYKMNETEAAVDMGFDGSQWFKFKARKGKQAEFDLILTRIRGNQLKNCIEAIDASGSDKEYSIMNKRGEKVELTKPGDWRAKAWIAERVLAPERLGDRQQAASVTNNNLFVGIDVKSIIQRIASERASKAIDVSCGVTKAAEATRQLSGVENRDENNGDNAS